MNELVLLMILFATIAYVAQPFWRKQAVVKFRSNNGQLTDLIEKRDGLLAQIKEIEFDHQTGKISAEDFAEINARYRMEAINTLRRIDALQGNNRTTRKLGNERRRMQVQRKNGALFCSQCGKSVGAADRFCVSCGCRLIS